MAALCLLALCWLCLVSAELCQLRHFSIFQYHMIHSSIQTLHNIYYYLYLCMANSFRFRLLNDVAHYNNVFSLTQNQQNNGSHCHTYCHTYFTRLQLSHI